MKKLTLVVVLLIVVVAAAAVLYVTLGRSREAQPRAEEVYVCPMHPQIVQDHPGDCPICGMKLVKQPAGPGQSGAGTDTSALEVSLSPSQEVLANVSVVEAETGEQRYRIALPGRVVPVEGRLVRVSVRTMGRVNKLHVSSSGEKVEKGESLFDYYGPDIAAAQRELALAYASASYDREALINAARGRLLSLGLSPDQVEDIRPGSDAPEVVTFKSPVDGYVVQKSVTEGQWLMPGADAFQIADLSTVWVEGTAYEPDAGRVRVNDAAEVTSGSYPGESFERKVVWVAPVLDPATRTLPFRVAIPNPALKLKPEMFARVTLTQAGARNAVLVPEEAVLSLGETQVVYVQVGPGRFRAREVVAGPSRDGTVPVYSGLEAGDRVAASGAYLIDSEARIKAMRGTTGGQESGREQSSEHEQAPDHSHH